jgi:8-oxo-dGTP pyrophosphatase MutT (NUDIX family)
VDTGEDYLTAARRELHEELGIDAPPLEPFYRLTPNQANGWEFIQAYRGHHEGPLHPAPLEVETGAFFPKEKILSWTRSSPQDFSPVFLQILNGLHGDPALPHS